MLLDNGQRQSPVVRFCVLASLSEFWGWGRGCHGGQEGAYVDAKGDQRGGTVGEIEEKKGLVGDAPLSRD